MAKVKPIKMGQCHYPKSLDFEGLIQEGQNPKGFTAETANGTAKYGDNPGWNQNIKWPSFPAERTGPWRDGNRTGE